MTKDYIAERNKKEYFSQNREDLILEAFFPNVKKGFYVDIGGFDPDIDSVTKFFYKRGWHGINIEPQPERWQKFELRRPRDINLNLGISDKNGTMTLDIYESGGLSTFSKELQKGYEEQQSSDTHKVQELKVPVKTLKSALKDIELPKTIHFMKVDVEGLEYQVLASNDWKRCRPEVICIEANHIVNDWRYILRDNGYEKVFFDGLNDYYCLSDSEYKNNFDYVQHMTITRGGGIHTNDLTLIRKLSARIETLYRQNLKDVEKVKRLEDENVALKEKLLLLDNPRIALRHSMRRLLDTAKGKRRG